MSRAANARGAAQGGIAMLLAPVLALVMLGAACASEALPQGPIADFHVQRMALGTGTPAAGPAQGRERARHVADGHHHVPGYLPGHPSAATLWPREVALECELDAQGRWRCGGVDLHPALGRGEYLYMRPLRHEAAPAPVLQVQCGCCAHPPAPLTRKKPLE